LGHARCGPAAGEAVVQPSKNQSCHRSIRRTVHSPDQNAADRMRRVKPRIDGVRHLQKIHTAVRVCQVDQTNQEYGATPKNSAGMTIAFSESRIVVLLTFGRSSRTADESKNARKPVRTFDR
jgi:hypothetical protein